jgi:transposase-like protein
MSGRTGNVSACPYATRGELLDAAREAGGPVALADELGVHPSSVRRWARRLEGRSLPAVPTSTPWGGRRARLVEPATTATTETVVFVSDIHAPYHDEAALASAFRLIADVAPDRVVLNGDMADFFQISRHNRDGRRVEGLQHELDVANAIRRAFREAAPDAVIDETEGNHDSRLRTFIAQQAPALKSLRAIDPANLCEWSEHGIRPHGAEGFLLRPEFLVYHGTRARQVTGTTARAELGAAGISGTSGHTHRLGPGYDRTGYGKRREWWESGCLCQLTPDYITGAPDWRHGLLVGLFSTRTDAYTVEMAQALEGGLAFGGRAY